MLPFVDVIVFPFVYPAGFLLKLIRRGGVHRMRLSKRALLQVGVFPIRNHYYEKAKCPFLTPESEPGSLYLRKR
jgi:hypothetical protein